jgi:hypothetical protein
MSDGAATKIPREAREGLMRAWVAILKERHPQVTWIARDPGIDDDAVNVTPEADSSA